MISTLLRKLFSRLPNGKGGDLPAPTALLNEFYAQIDVDNRWQGDVYPKNSFATEILPTQDVPYWMLVNRTCHLYEGGGRLPKLPSLSYVAAYPLESFLVTSRGAPNLKNQISAIVRERQENAQFLPAYETQNIRKPLVANFNLVHTFKIEHCPRAAQKVLQLASPFCEHVFQRFARFYYTVGFDDARVKSDEYIAMLVEYVEQLTRHKPQS